MKHIICFAYVLLCASAFSQISTEFVTTADVTNLNWNTYIDNQEFKIEYKRTDCDLNSGLDQQYMFVKMTNKTHNEITLSWEMDMFFNGDCKTCGIGEYEWQYTLAPLQSVEGDCAIGAEKKLRLFVKFIDQNITNTSVMTGFKYSNLTIH